MSEYGTVQCDIPADSEAARALDQVRATIATEDLAGEGVGCGGNHITVRYGLSDDDLAGVLAYLAQQQPFEVELQATTSFPPNRHTEHAAVVIAPVESAELDRMNAELEHRGNFKRSDFAQFRPHATIAYVKSESVDRYTGNEATEGIRLPVTSVTVCGSSGTKTIVPLQAQEQQKPPALFSGSESK